MGRRWLDAESAADLGRLDSEAISRVKEEAWLEPGNAEELHDALLWLGALSDEEARAKSEWQGWLKALAADRRGDAPRLPAAPRLWIAAERLNQFTLVWPEGKLDPEVTGQEQPAQTREEALVEIIRARLEGLGPVTATRTRHAARPRSRGCRCRADRIGDRGLRDAGAGSPPAGNEEEWCDRASAVANPSLHVRRLRAEIEPVAAKDFLRFLFQWHRVTKTRASKVPMR